MLISERNGIIDEFGGFINTLPDSDDINAEVIKSLLITLSSSDADGFTDDMQGGSYHYVKELSSLIEKQTNN